MVAGSSKRIVVIRDIPSNIIEEAILILKGEPGSIADNSTKDSSGKLSKVDSDFLLKEAELIINNYIKEHKSRNAQSGGETFKTHIMKRKFLVTLAINLALVGGIAMLVFLLTRLL